jgi:hypothetical protein
MLNLGLGHHDRRPKTVFGLDWFKLILNRMVEHMAVQKYDSIQGLPLRGGRNPAMSGQMAQKGVDLSLSHLCRMGFGAMKLDESKYLIAVSLFGAVSVMVVAQHLTDLVHQFQFRIGFKFFHVSTIIS